MLWIMVAEPLSSASLLVAYRVVDTELRRFR